MKIYEIGTGYTPIPATMGAATEIVVEELTKSMRNIGEDVSIIDIKAVERPKNNLPIIEVNVPNKFTGTDVELGIMHKLKRVVYSISLAFKLKALLKKEKEKVVLHFHNQYNMFFFLKLTNKSIKNKCFLAYTNHSYIWHDGWKNIKEIIKKRYFQEVYSMKNADMVYVLNKHTADTLINYIGIDKNKIILIDNGVNTDIYKPLLMSEKKDLKKELGLEDKKIFLQVGSVCDRKNQLETVTSLLPLLKEDNDVCFAYAGGIISKEYQEKITELAKENGVLDRVIYLGELKPGKELNKYYNIAKALIFPSKSEGFSLVIIEAMSSGLPVIIGKNLQFKLSNSCLKYAEKGEIVNMIKENIINETKQKELSNMARESVINDYCWNKVAMDYLKSWENLCK